ncbi:hypothetical protein BDZ91DRAFT_733994, partial [Kalaharituber pfeilii]
MCRRLVSELAVTGLPTVRPLILPLSYSDSHTFRASAPHRPSPPHLSPHPPPPLPPSLSSTPLPPTFSLLHTIMLLYHHHTV